MAQLFQAQQAGSLADLTSQLRGQQAQQLMQILQIAREVGQPILADKGNSSAHPDTDTDSAPDSTMQSESESESTQTDASGSNRRRMATRHRIAPDQAQQMLEQSDKDIIVIDEQVELHGLETVRLTTGWKEVLKQEEES